MNNKWYKKPEMIVALSALLISLVTAFVGIYSAYIDRAYARASVWPRLEIFDNNYTENGVGVFDYGVTNNGTGPAIIKHAKVQYQSKAIKYWKDIPEMTNIRQSHLGSRILPPMTTVKPVQIKNSNLASKALKVNSLVGIEICYCSIYDECWVIDRANQPKQIQYCKINEDEKFLQ